MKVIKMNRKEIRENFYLFEVLVQKEGSMEEFQIKRFGKITDEQMVAQIESCKEFSDIFYLDDSRHTDLSVYEEYRRRFNL